MGVIPTDCEICGEPLELQNMLNDSLDTVDDPKICDECMREFVFDDDEEVEETY